MEKPPQPDPFRELERRSVAARRVGNGAKCVCGESRPGALIPGSKPIICAEFQRAKQGKSGTDRHHPFGQANSPVTIPAPVNDHRGELSAKQHTWPKMTLENQHGSPLLAAAGHIRGFIDTVSYLLGKLLWIAELLEAADSYLNNVLGLKWWLKTEIERWAPKRKFHEKRQSHAFTNRGQGIPSATGREAR